MAPSYSKIYHRVAHKEKCFVVMAPSYSKFYPRVAHKRHATLQWLLPFLNFTFELPTKGMLRCNGFFLL